MDKVRFGIIGVGNMGHGHAKWLLEGKVARGELVAIADRNPEKLKAFPHIKSYADGKQLLRNRDVDAVLVATPHYDHTTLGVAALQRGFHVLLEKPISVHKADCEKLLAAYAQRPKPTQVFSAMFNQRTDPFYQKIRELVRGGELGEVRRINWIISNWFRSEAYYASGGWRATWAGEGGGVLLNQCPHNIDLYQWIFGMPARVRAFCSLGRYHKIEVEDDVTAYFEYPNGTTAVFITSTGEAPGTNRLEITAENGKLVYEKNQIVLTKNEIPMTEFSRTTTQSFATPKNETTTLTLPDNGSQHVGILNNFVEAILDGKPLLAPAVEGIHSVELANAMLFSSLKQKTIEMPLDAKAYARTLKGLIKNSKLVKPAAQATAPAATTDLSKSFNL
ncbi:MAG: Inositol 2-dehydrogenase/D-chiro-inositol 3-dehydrogenase [Verrucomicrobiae bacterium]|nr:Inositol 2-dehydrogenase/D-chiro-inositol 3-dehydrogenase [Verrucomicrobiae bacterium]